MADNLARFHSSVNSNIIPLCSRCHHEQHRKGEPVDRIVNIRFTPSEYEALKAAVGERNVAPAIRAIVAQAVKQGIEISK